MAPAPGRWKKIESLYHAAREREPSARAAFLAEACANDDGLRSEVESLLAEDVTTLGLVDGPAGDLFASSLARSAPRQLVNGRFEVIRRVGAGGMGVVYEAWDKERNIRTALKTLAGFDPEAIYLFKNEFRSLADVSHPHLIALYELFSEEGQWFFSMEYVEGAHFLEFVRSAGGPASPPPEPARKALAPDEPTFVPGRDGEAAWPGDARRAAAGQCDLDKLRSALGQLTQAVMALHSAGILHRDLKPANVKITPEGRVVVLDFGVAAQQVRSRYGEATVHEGLLGTVPYMSPEQVMGKPITEAADWYAVGVMLYEALTGRRPFEGAVGQVLLDKQNYEAPSASRFAGIPEDLDGICGGLVTRDPARRMTGREVLARLKWDGTESARIPAFPQQTQLERTFVGRDVQLAALAESFAAVERGATCVAFIHGRSGIGKSALVERFLTGLNGRRDVVILAGRCYEQESVPYKALDSAVDALARYLARLPRPEVAELTPRDAFALARIFPVLRRVAAIEEAPQRSGPALEQHELRRRAFGALRELLGRLGDRKRVVLYIDDLQWGDADSAALLTEVLRDPEAPVLMLIGSWRDGYEGRSAFLDALKSEPLGGATAVRRDLPLGSLSAAETRQLAMRLAGIAAVERVEEMARESEGNPYLLAELAGGAAFGSTLEKVLQERVVALPEEARRLMEIVAVSGRPLRQREAWSASGVPAQDPGLLASLRAVRLIGGAGAEIECYHDRVRESIVAHLDPAALRHCHSRLAETLASSEGDAERIAVHFEGAENREQASHYYAMAAEGATSTLAFKRAAELYQRTLDLSPLDGDDRRRLMVKLAEALANAGKGHEAALIYERALDGAHGTEVYELERKIAYWHSVSGHVDEGRAALEKMLRRVGIKTPRRRFLLPAMVLREIALLLGRLKFRARSEAQIPREVIDRLDAVWDATCSFGMVDVPMGIYFTQCNLLLALKAGESKRIARALMLATLGAVGIPVIGAARAHRLMALLEKLAGEIGTPYFRGAVLFSRSFIDMCIAGRWRNGLDQLRQAEQIFASCSGVAWELSTTRIFAIWALLYLGQYAELRRLSAVYTHDARERGDLYEETSIGASTVPFVEMVRGWPVLAMAMLEDTLGRWTRRTYSSQHATSAYIRTWILLYSGEGVQALAFLDGEWPKVKKNLYDRLSMLGAWLYYSRGESALAAARNASSAGDLLRIAERAARRLEKDPVPYVRSLAELIRAGCAARRGDMTLAVRLLETAAGRLEEQDMAMMAAAARWRLGEVIGGDRGLRLIAAAELAMKAEGVREPARLADVFVNGFKSR